MLQCYKNNGFSLVELLVVMAIMMVLFFSVYINQRNSQPQYLLRQGEQKLASDLRRAQNMAMSGSNLSGNYYGYGIYLQTNSNSYILYGERTDTGADSTIYNSSGAVDTIIETISFPRSVKINSSPFPSDQAHIFFKSPDPTTTISDGADPTKTSVSIVLKADGSSATRNVQVTSAGLIEAQ
jgi:prepilin-type N-terminal cleavage/methylation domain-containing protein